MVLINNQLVAELSDVLRYLGKLDATSLELQFQGQDLLEYRHTLSKIIDLTATLAYKLESDEKLYPRPLSYFKSLTRNLSVTNTLDNLEERTEVIKNRFEVLYLAYGEDLKLIRYFITKLYGTKRGILGQCKHHRQL